MPHHPPNSPNNPIEVTGVVIGNKYNGNAFTGYSVRITSPKSRAGQETVLITLKQGLYKKGDVVRFPQYFPRE